MKHCAEKFIYSKLNRRKGVVRQHGVLARARALTRTAIEIAMHACACVRVSRWAAASIRNSRPNIIFNDWKTIIAIKADDS